MIAQYTQSNWSMANDCNDWTLDLLNTATIGTGEKRRYSENSGIQKTAVLGVTYIL